MYTYKLYFVFQSAWATGEKAVVDTPAGFQHVSRQVCTYNIILMESQFIQPRIKNTEYPTG